MIADWADLRSLLADHDVTAVRALPDHVPVTREDNIVLNVFQKLPVTLLMSLLYRADLLEQECDLVESLLPGGLGEPRVHVSPLVVLAGGGIGKVLLR